MFPFINLENFPYGIKIILWMLGIALRNAILRWELIAKLIVNINPAKFDKLMNLIIKILQNHIVLI